jgi:hypothetical protein
MQRPGYPISKKKKSLPSWFLAVVIALSTYGNCHDLPIDMNLLALV